MTRSVYVEEALICLITAPDHSSHILQEEFASSLPLVFIIITALLGRVGMIFLDDIVTHFLDEEALSGRQESHCSIFKQSSSVEKLLQVELFVYSVFCLPEKFEAI